MGETINKNLELKKHVAAIHSSNKLSLLQRKIANALLFNAYDEILIKEEHTLHIATLCNLIGYDSNDHKTIKKSLVNLLATVIEWNLVDGDKLNNNDGVWNASSIIADASIDGPVCTYSYSNKMKKLLHHPELYGRLNMVVQAKFQSSYGLALYENCIRFQGIDQTPWFDIAKFRKLMGVEDGKYKIFRDFKTRVLDKAIAEVNEHSPIKVTAHFQKVNRKVTAIQFLIKQTKVARQLTTEKTEKSLPDTLKLVFGLSKKQIEDVLTQYEEKYIVEKINLIESSASYVNGKIANLAKYLLSALQDDYQPAKSSSRSKITLPQPKKIESVQHTQQKHLKIEEYRRYQSRELIKLINNKSESVKNKILQEFEKFLGKGIYLDIYLRENFSSALIQDQFSKFVRERKPELLANIDSFAQFCAVV